MRELKAELITKAVRDMVIDANICLPADLEARIVSAAGNETGELPKSVMGDLVKNLDAARELNIPVCQDTGLVVVFAEIGQELHITGGGFDEAVNEGVRQGYKEGFLRKSVVADPLRRVNTEDNSPAVIHAAITGGDRLKLTVSPKGFGSENMSALKMMLPTANKGDITEFVLETVKKAGANPCPPVVLGVGIGGDFEYSAILAKKALCRSVSERNGDKFYADFEIELLNKINELNIGPQGFGGKTTALAVNIEAAPTHIAGLPVAVNIGCHVTRHKSIII
ncbi:MAG: fumarate hydratase [Oscillospiraceae bacterium]|nr:fumarate hydratase [Oscillospiraceae bacterium]